jgi:anti-sigma B factor antagonist
MTRQAPTVQFSTADIEIAGVGYSWFGSQGSPEIAEADLREHTVDQPSRGEERVLMEITERIVGGVTILDLKGRLTIDDGAQLLKDKSESLVFQRRDQVIVNLGGVPYIDSGGLGQLVACYTTLARAGGRLTLLNVNKRNHDLLTISKLVAVFETFDTEQTAIESYPAAARL